MGALLQILSGPSGKPSSMRVAMLVTVFTVMGTWSWVSIQKQELQPISPEVSAVLLGIVWGKGYQRTAECKPEAKKEQGNV